MKTSYDSVPRTHESVLRSRLFIPTDAIQRTAAPLSLFIIILYACIVNYPCARWGVPSGDDRVVHITYFHFFDEQLQTGELYPRWISGLNFGAGSPIFFIQYPLPYYAAAGLRRVFHLPATLDGQARALGLFLLCTGVLSGIFVWLWCRRLANSTAAIFAAIVSLTLPYTYSCDVYTRVTIGEYSALAWVPLALFFCHQLNARRAFAVAGIAFAFAMVIFSNVLTSVLCVPFLIPYALCCVGWRRLRETTVLMTCALFLGASLSGIYLLPMIVNSRLFSMEHLVRLGPDIFFYKLHLFPYGQHLFPTGSFQLKTLDVFSWVLGTAIAVNFMIQIRGSEGGAQKLLSGIAAVFLLFLCSAPLLSFAGFAGHQEIAGPRVIAVRSRVFLASFLTLEMALFAYASLRSRVNPLAHFLVASCLTCCFIATRWSDAIWQHVPFLWNIQFPWRSAGLLSIFAVGLFALALQTCLNSQSSTHKPILVGLITLTVLINVSGVFVFDTLSAYVRHYPARVLSKIETMYPSYATVSRLPTSAELGANDGLADGVGFLDGLGVAKLQTVDARHLQLQASCLNTCTLVVKLVYYPLWHALDSSKQPIPLRAASARPGLTQLSLGPGFHEVDLELSGTRSESYGAWLSLCSAIGVFMLFSLWRRQPKLRGAHAG